MINAYTEIADLINMFIVKKYCLYNVRMLSTDLNLYQAISEKLEISILSTYSTYVSTEHHFNLVCLWT